MKKLIFLTVMIASLYAEVKTVVIEVEGMTCPLCTTAIKKSLKKTKGVIKAKVKLSTKKATVTYDNKLTNKTKLLKAIEKVGYKGKILKNK
ncbi:MAG: heavy-metal-associated domain-containing protein [Epsilonproteobacteria bacterium]|nr:heavy-metal-associated domain-containing protein [Campylobacterota bacterium]